MERKKEEGRKEGGEGRASFALSFPLFNEGHNEAASGQPDTTTPLPTASHFIQPLNHTH